MGMDEVTYDMTSENMMKYVSNPEVDVICNILDTFFIVPFFGGVIP